MTNTNQSNVSKQPPAPGGGLITGASYPFRALVVLRRNRNLWQYVLVPCILNIIIGIILYIFVLFTAFQALEQLFANVPDSPLVEFFTTILNSLLIIVLFIAIGFLLVRFGVVLGAPWYSTLSEKLEHIRSQQPAPQIPITIGSIASDIWRALLFELQKLLLTIMVGLPLLLLNLLPPIGTTIATVGGIALATLIAWLDFLDPPLSRRGASFNKRIGILRRNLLLHSGFGLICFGLISIPLLNLLAIPLCIAAGTLLFCDQVAPTVDNPST